MALAALTGCSGFGAASFPDASVNPAQVPVGTIQGSVYGGHAPLVGAHVYLLSPGTSGYGSQATSLLCDAGSAANCTTTLTKNASDPNIPTSWYYVPTDTTGSFSLSGEYTCTAGNPVYLYAYGGSPTFPANSNTFNVTNISSVGSTGEVTFTVSPTENAYIGELVTFNNLSTVNGFNALDGPATRVIDSVNLTTSTFSVNVGAGDTGDYSAGGDSGGTAVLSPTFNPAAVNLAVLGVCPSTGTLASGGTLFNGTTSSAINFIYLNEISTVAAAYAFEGFTPATVTSTTNATDIGSTSTNLIGIQNAALNAAQLFDIRGSQITTSYAGEGHIANPKTPAGNGSVPQNLLDTLGNILAACVDSNNQSTVDGNINESAQCATLFETATSNGIPTASIAAASSGAVLPVDTAQAIFNIAHHPAGNPTYTSTFMSQLYSLPAGNVPFTPNLASSGAGQPNDFTVAIQYPKTFTANSKITSATSLTANAAAAGPESIAIDGYGNAWLDDLNGENAPFNILELNPQGVLAYTGPTSQNRLGYVTIDPDNDVYYGTNYSQGDETEIVAAGTANTSATRTVYTWTGDYGTTAPFNSDGFFNGYMSVANGAGNVYIGATSPATNNGNGSSAQAYTLGLEGSMNLTTTGTTGSYPLTSLFTPVSMGTSAGSIGAHGVVENASTNGSGDIWWSNEVYEGSGLTVYAINRVSTSGVVASGFPITYASNNAIDRTEMPAIDQNGNLWAAARLSNTLVEVTQSGTVTTHTGNTLNTPFGVAIDGANNLFIAANLSGNAIAEFSIANNTNISPGTNGYTLGGQLNDPLNVTMDQSGNLWITTNANNTIVQWIGAGAPAYNPLSLASKNNAIATKP